MITETPDLRNSLDLPRLSARDLEGRAVSLPDDLGGEHSLVIVAFRREQQPIVDSWIAWYESIVNDPTLGCDELVVIATRWSPARPFIDGGMARAVRERHARRRTLTVYPDARRVRDALAIDDTWVVTVLLVGADGRLRGRTTGSVNEEAGSGLLCVLAVQDSSARPHRSPAIEEFAFDFGRRFHTAMGQDPGATDRRA